MKTDGRSRLRALPPTYHIAQAEAPTGQTAYCISFGQSAPHLVMHGARTAREYERPLGVFIAADSTTITVYLNGPDENLALLRWLTATFRPEKHHGTVRYHTYDDNPHVIISFVDSDSTDDLWGVAATLSGVDGVMGVDVRRNVCIVEVRPGTTPEMAWEMLHEEAVQHLVVFDSHQAPPK